MDSFYLIVAGVAAVFLILMLAFITYAMMQSKSGLMTPVHDPATGQYTNSLCPDYWEYDATNGVCLFPSNADIDTSSSLTTKLNQGPTGLTAATAKSAWYLDSGANKVQFTNAFKSAGNASVPAPSSTAGSSFQDTANRQGIKPDASDWQFYGTKELGEVCSKYQWSKDTGIHWSGYSNANQCA